MKIKIIPIIMASALILSACGSDPKEPNSNSSSNTSAVAPKTKIDRVVALTSLSADILANLDRSKLVGITGSRILADKANLKDLPRVAEGRTPPNLEKIISLKPDLVIGAKGMHDNVLTKLKTTGIQTLATEVTSWEALEQLTVEIAKLTKLDPQPLLDRYNQMVSTPAKLPGKTLILASDKPMISPNTKSWAGGLLDRLKIVNASAGVQGKSPFQGYITLSPEKILESNPDRILIVQNQPGEGSKIKDNPFWSQLTAVKKDRVHTFDYYGLVNPGSIDSIEAAIKQLKALPSQ